MRGMMEGLPSPHPIGALLPGLYHDDDFAQRFTSALDEVIAPVLATLDSVEAYVDPHLAPRDFIDWLAQWVGVELDHSWPLERRRQLVARAANTYAWHGTARGLRELIELHTGAVAEIEETGGVAFSPVPDGELPGSPDSRVTIRVRVADPSAVDAARLERLVSRVVPAEVIPKVEVLPA